MIPRILHRAASLAADVAREKVCVLTRADEVERLRAANADLNDMRRRNAEHYRDACEGLRTVTQERDAARAEVERLGDVIAELRTVVAAAREAVQRAPARGAVLRLSLAIEALDAKGTPTDG